MKPPPAAVDAAAKRISSILSGLDVPIRYVAECAVTAALPLLGPVSDEMGSPGEPDREAETLRRELADAERRAAAFESAFRQLVRDFLNLAPATARRRIERIVDEMEER